MIMTEVKLALGRTVNLGNFESLRVDLEVSATLDEGEDAAVVRGRLSNWLKSQVQHAIREARE